MRWGTGDGANPSLQPCQLGTFFCQYMVCSDSKKTDANLDFWPNKNNSKELPNRNFCKFRIKIVNFETLQTP